MFGVFPLTPAYGRDYKSQKEVEADWKAGKDFRCVNGRYCSIRDFPGQKVQIRFAKLTKVCFV